MGQNCAMADFSKLPVKNELVQLVLRDFFRNQLDIIKQKDCFMMTLFQPEQENMRKGISKSLFVS